VLAQLTAPPSSLHTYITPLHVGRPNYFWQCFPCYGDEYILLINRIQWYSWLLILAWQAGAHFTTFCFQQRKRNRMRTASHLTAVVPNIFDITPPSPVWFSSYIYVSRLSNWNKCSPLHSYLHYCLWWTNSWLFHPCVWCIYRNLKNMHKILNMILLIYFSVI
jgi:hypothetical protein